MESPRGDGRQRSARAASTARECETWLFRPLRGGALSSVTKVEGPLHGRTSHFLAPRCSQSCRARDAAWHYTLGFFWRLSVPILRPPTCSRPSDAPGAPYVATPSTYTLARGARAARAIARTKPWFRATREQLDGAASRKARCGIVIFVVVRGLVVCILRMRVLRLLGPAGISAVLSRPAFVRVDLMCADRE